MTLTPTNTSTHRNTQDDISTEKNNFNGFLVPTRDLKKYTEAGFVPLTSLSTQQSKKFIKDGVLEWSNKKWEISKPTVSTNETSLSGINNDGFIKIIDNTPSAANNSYRLSFYKKVE